MSPVERYAAAGIALAVAILCGFVITVLPFLTFQFIFFGMSLPISPDPAVWQIMLVGGCYVLMVLVMFIGLDRILSRRLQ